MSTREDWNLQLLCVVYPLEIAGLIAGDAALAAVGTLGLLPITTDLTESALVTGGRGLICIGCGGHIGWYVLLIVQAEPWAFPGLAAGALGVVAQPFGFRGYRTAKSLVHVALRCDIVVV